MTQPAEPTTPELPLTTDEVQRLRRADAEHYIHANTTLRTHVELGPTLWIRGEGCRLQDATGRWYYDGPSSLWNVNIGHGRRELAEAAYRQMSQLEFASAFASSSNRPSIELAQRLAALVPGSLTAMMFGTGGGEMVDTAIKIARYYWQTLGKPTKTTVIARTRAFHGVTLGSTSATGLPVYWDNFGPRVPGFVHIEAPYPYRCAPGSPALTGEALEQKILELGAENVAAFIAEPVIGGGGVIPPPADYWRQVRAVCTKHDVLLIDDEVICGFGRTGRWFGVQHWDVVPDIMVVAKGLTSGALPLSAAIVTRQIFEVMKSRPGDPAFMHGHTASGHPASCAVALENLRIIEAEGLVERARVRGEYLARKLAALRELPAVGETRGLGLMAAVEFVQDKATRERLPAELRFAKRVSQLAFDRGLIARALAGPGDMIGLAPPLIVSEQDLDAMVDILGEAIEVAGAELAR